MRIAIFGASGGVGRRVVTLAAQRGHHPIAVVRPQSAGCIPWPEGAQERVCEAYSGEGVSEALADCAAVVSCLGIRRRNRLNPWSPLRSPADTTTVATRNILAAMRPATINRIACVSAAGVGDSFSHTAAPIRWMIQHSNMAPAYADLAAMEQHLDGSDRSWLAVRPTTLSSLRHGLRYTPTQRYGCFSHIPRRAVAAALLDYVTARPEAPAAGCQMISGA